MGHAAGDRLLCAIAKRVKGQVRSADTVARLGGDEFAVLLEDVNGVRNAKTVARKLLAAIREPIDLAGGEVCASVSLGIVLYPRDGEDSATLLSHADAAVYKAKRARLQSGVPETVD